MSIPKVIGDWKIIKLLGNGGMGIVLLGTHQRTGKQSAIKLMLPDALESESAHKRFLKEISALRSIQSPYVAELLDYSNDRRNPWYALEFVSDFSLHDTMKMHGKFSDQAWWNLARGVLKAVDAIHSAGVIHRDLKPQNIMMSKQGPKIIDFGLAKSFSSLDSVRQTRRGEIMGTMAYMPPEQHEGMLKTTEKSDIYSAGVMLIEAAGMTLQEIWRGNSEAEVIANKFNSSPNISKLAKNQQALLAKMIKISPEDRLSAKQLLRQLDKLSQDNRNVKEPKAKAKPGFLTKLDNWNDRMEKRANEQKAKAEQKKKQKANNKQPLGAPAKEVEVEPQNPIWPDQEFPIARPKDRVIAYWIDVPLFLISLGLVQLWFLFKSKGQLTAGRKLRKVLVIDSKTRKPVSGKRALFRGLVLQYGVFTIIPFVSTTDQNGWYVFVSPLLVSLLMFLPTRKNPWDFLTQTTVGKFE